MKNLSATIKGLITGLIMILASYGIWLTKKDFENNLQYVVYAIYIAGILWSLVSFKNNSTAGKTFKSYFSEGFKCFIVVTLMMVAFTYVFVKMNPSLKIEMAENYRKELVQKGNSTEAEINNLVGQAKQYFEIMLVSMAIFGYLVIGAIITAIASAFLGKAKTNNEILAGQDK